MTAFSRLRAEKNVDTEDNITSAVPLINTDKLFSKYEKNEFDFQPLQTETEIPTKKISGSAFSNLRKEKEGEGMNSKRDKQYRKENTGIKLKTAVTGDGKPGSKAAKRRKSVCARSKGWTGERGKAARRRWKC